ncbi:MAG TPA: M56 family metallopeptidase [Polyangiaceae bacterium]|nr:M56 family metallopeptidase [Polyangiaceae bacterium]
MSVLATLQLFSSAALLCALLAGLVTSSVVRLSLARTASWAPQRRHRVLALLCLFPALFGFSTFLAALSRSLLALAWPAYDHCLGHEDLHVHLCFVHRPAHLGNWGSSLLLLAALAWISVRLALAGVELGKGQRWAARLIGHAGERPELGVRVLPILAPVCMVVGVFRPVIVLSRGLLQRVDSDDLQVILGHERAHAARADVRFRLLARATTLFMLPGARKRLLEALELASEQSCDDAAARLVGDRLKVAEAILKVERMFGELPSTSPALAVSFGGTRVDERVRSLLEPQPRLGSLVLTGGCLAVACGSVLATGAYVHHWLESLLGLLTH